MERETMCIQAGYSPKNGESRMIPIIQSTTFKYDTSEDMGKLFDLEASGYFYTRLQNPTNDMVAAKLAALEGGTAGMLTSSGQAANFFSVFNIATCGDHIVSASTIYGGTYDCLTGIVTSDKDSGGGDITPTYQQTATANCETNLGENNIWADTGNTSLEAFKFGR